MVYRIALAACLCTLFTCVASASPGDVFVPAHRTRDGTLVPPNVAPLSGGTHLARRPSRLQSVAARSDSTRFARLRASAR